MNNSEIARIFEEIADMLEMKDESPFKVRAYQKAAMTLQYLPVGVDQLVQDGTVREVEGIGEALAKKITELVTTGRLEYYERLKAEFPEDIQEIRSLPGVGPKTAMRLVKELGIRSAADLETAILDGRVAELPHVGEKAAAKMLQGLQSRQTKKQCAGSD